MFSFWKFRMPSAHNGVEAMKSALDNEDYEWAEKVADSAQKNLEEALKETNAAIERRDSGKSRADDPDVEDGIRW